MWRRLSSSPCPRGAFIKTLVLGLGNDMYGDDGVGLEVVRLLKAELSEGSSPPWCPEEADLAECTVSGLALLDVITGYDALVIVDTIKRSNPETGRVHLLDAQDLRSIPGPSPHYVSVPQTIEVGRCLGLRVPFLIKVVGVEAKNLYSLGESISPDMAACLPEILNRVKEVLRGLPQGEET